MNNLNLKQIGKRAVIAFGATGAVLVAAMAPAAAAIDASVATALASLQTDATDLSKIVIPIVVAVMGLFITIKLIKKFGNKVG